jgi:hypothetical protein
LAFPQQAEMSITVRRSGFYDGVADRRTHSMKKPQSSLPDLIRQSILLRRLMDTRVILREDALRAFARA